MVCWLYRRRSLLVHIKSLISCRYSSIIECRKRLLNVYWLHRKWKWASHLRNRTNLFCLVIFILFGVNNLFLICNLILIYVNNYGCMYTVQALEMYSNLLIINSSTQLTITTNEFSSLTLEAQTPATEHTELFFSRKHRDNTLVSAAIFQIQNDRLIPGTRHLHFRLLVSYSVIINIIDRINTFRIVLFKTSLFYVLKVFGFFQRVINV